VSVDNGLLNLSVIDSSDKTSNVFSIYVDGTFTDSDFELVFNISNLKMIDGDYDVKISDQRFISHFVNRDNGVQYWVALEKK
jgi:hypothetical protein